MTYDGAAIHRVNLLPSGGAPPTRGLLTVPGSISGQAGADWQSEIFKTILCELPAEIELLVAGHAKTLRQIQTWPIARNRPIEFLSISSELDFTAWCQDPFLSAGAGASNRPVFLLPKLSPRNADLAVSQIVAESIGAQILNTPMCFEGGNVLIGDTFILMGGDTLCDQDAGTPSDVLTGMGELRPVHVLGQPTANRRRVRLCDDALGPFVEECHGFVGRSQPIFHLDAFISLAGHAPDGRTRVLVGDPRPAASLIGDHPLIGHDALLADELDQIATDLKRRLTCEVIRNPLPVFAVDDDGLARWSRRSVALKLAGADGLDDVLHAIDRRRLTGIRVRRWCLATQNSALAFDGLASGKSVLLPSYAQGRFRFLDASERCNAALWSQMGYRVSAIPGFAGFASANGSAHCLFKSLTSAPGKGVPAR